MFLPVLLLVVGRCVTVAGAVQLQLVRCFFDGLKRTLDHVKNVGVTEPQRQLLQTSQQSLAGWFSLLTGLAASTAQDWHQCQTCKLAPTRMCIQSAALAAQMRCRDSWRKLKGFIEKEVDVMHQYNKDAAKAAALV